MGIPILKIRRLWDRLIFNMGIPILVRHLYIEMAPWCVSKVNFDGNITLVAVARISILVPIPLYLAINSLWPGNTIWRQRSGSKLSQVMAWSLNQCSSVRFCGIHLRVISQEREREREIKFISLFEDRGHRGPYKPFNHNLYIGIIIFPHIDNPQSTGYN